MPISKNSSASATKPLACANLPLPQSTPPTHGNRANGRLHKRSRSGCFTCRLRRKKCDENHPACTACINLNVRCEYKRPIWWGNAEQRRAQKERIKNRIKQTKMLERNGNFSDPLTRHRHMSAASPTSPVHEHGRPRCNETYDIFSSQLPTPGLGSAPRGPYVPSYEVDVRTERQTFINDVPMRHDSSTSTFSAFAPPRLSAPMPTFSGDEWFRDEYFAQASAFNGTHPGSINPSLDHTRTLLQSNIVVSDHDQPLLDHFIHNVLRQIFPVLEAHQKGHLRAQSILRALETNKCYLHCCLSVAAIHLKTTEGLVGEQIDHDIMRHRYEAISQLCQALGDDVNHDEILDATLAMILFHCAVGPSDDYLPDIPWFDHFQAASNLVTRLELPSAIVEDPSGYLVPPFSMSLTTWIDILGSTMVGKSPDFAHQYRSKHLGGAPSGLRELMGCDDRIMYLISEIACLDSLKNEGRIDDLAVCSHAKALEEQLEYTQPADPTLENPFSPATGAIRPEALTKTISHVFRTASRIYLCSIVPGFDRNQASIEGLITAVTDALQFIPAGPHGYDRSLVWPLLMTGVFSRPSSSFRSVIAGRADAMGDHGDLGSFGRMYRLLQEVWRLTDEPLNSFQGFPGDNSYNSSLTSPISRLDGSKSPSGAGATLGGREIKKQEVHWKEIMKRNNWHYLLI
ncbi:C6 sexual development transcription factor NosA [Penicillium digitatum]|uniref:C6 sexual development transcription factor NosA n=3 Tax=Penicillium digitatum TaxID=36651 RepID=K9G350_PEND2|nr:C6 sexual development transcription factor NosA [Penicillium digitatum Pd1]EKV07798.1 C6 sexual development transcription factor NosA [Penicillium digitatum Pd1]EKV09288.1 C6 sexual development transcription factor NosA [Penicillium digitatum PHI26]QQK41413.1 C6 sexual development transcription factor NosA [Penicillium digitatum]